MGQHQGPPGHHLRPASNASQVSLPTGSARHSLCHYAPRPLLLSLRACLESPHAQQLASLRTTTTNVFERNCAHFLESRLDLFWSEDWPALWGMVRAECDDATPTSRGTTKSAAEHRQSRVRKVATLTRTGERGRALAAARKAPPVPGHPADCTINRELVPRSSGPCSRCPDGRLAHLPVLDC